MLRFKTDQHAGVFLRYMHIDLACSSTPSIYSVKSSPSNSILSSDEVLTYPRIQKVCRTSIKTLIKQRVELTFLVHFFIWATQQSVKIDVDI